MPEEPTVSSDDPIRFRDEADATFDTFDTLTKRSADRGFFLVTSDPQSARNGVWARYGEVVWRYHHTPDVSVPHQEGQPVRFDLTNRRNSFTVFGLGELAGADKETMFAALVDAIDLLRRWRYG